MQKVIVISYFYPPCNLTASQRVKSWSDYLHKSKIYPFIITRKWEKKIKSFDDCHYATSKNVSVEKSEKSEIHYCPYTPNLRDKLHIERKKYFLKKLLSLLEIIFQNIWIKICPYNNILIEAEKVIKVEKNIKAIIISGNPFIQFKMGYILSKKHNIPWIADYRDAWTTSTINNISNSLIMNIINKYHNFFEKKWTKTCSYVTASSEPIGKSIELLSKVKSCTIFNGFEPNDFKEFKNIKKHNEYFQISYVGTLYDGQDISIFLNAYKKLIDFKEPKIKLLFAGLDLDKKQKTRVSSIMKGYESYYETSLRIPKKEILKIEKQSHLLLHVAWKGYEGIIASKIYEYVGSGTNILLVPGDEGSINQIVKETKYGSIFNDSDTTFDFLCDQYEKFKQNRIELSSVNKASEKFTRENQAKELGKLINNMIKE